MCDVENLDKKKKSLKSAIDRCAMYESFVNEYKEKKTMNLYIMHIKDTMHTLSESMADHYNTMISQYKRGNVEPLLSNLYDRLLFADENKTRLAEELKSMLGKV